LTRPAYADAIRAAAGGGEKALKLRQLEVLALISRQVWAKRAMSTKSSRMILPKIGYLERDCYRPEWQESAPITVIRGVFANSRKLTFPARTGADDAERQRYRPPSSKGSALAYALWTNRASFSLPHPNPGP
jgi:hypothetical protein